MKHKLEVGDWVKDNRNGELRCVIKINKDDYFLLAEDGIVFKPYLYYYTKVYPSKLEIVEFINAAAHRIDELESIANKENNQAALFEKKCKLLQEQVGVMNTINFSERNLDKSFKRHAQINIELTEIDKLIVKGA
jgi:hypothetical protein